jgi:hypothetical protein
MQEKIPKNSSENSSEDRSTPDFSQLAEAIKIWGKELGFQQVRIADAYADMGAIGAWAAAMAEPGLPRRNGLYGETRYPAHSAGGTRSGHATDHFGTHELYACGEG